MPLIHSSSNKAFKENVGTLMHEVGNSPHVQSRDQALAIAYETKRRAGHASGGIVGYDTGGGVADPVQAVITALTQSQGGGGGTGSIPAPNTSNQSAPSSTSATSATNNPTGVMPAAPGTPTTSQQPAAPATNPTTAPVGSNPATTSTGVAPAVNPTTNPIAKPLMASGGGLAAGGFAMQKAPSLNPTWETRQEARALHVGPVLSAVPGRQDNHAVKVPAGSYVLPAAHIASLGQGNSNAGLSIASRMFGGPYGTGAMKMGHGSLPHAPKPFTGFADGGYSEGGARGTGQFQPTPVNISGGEFVIPPEAIIRRYGSLKKGHAILDAWVMSRRKKEIETLKKLPPPAKK